MRIRAAVLRTSRDEPARRSRTSSCDPARSTRCSSASRRLACATPTCGSRTASSGDGRWPWSSATREQASSRRSAAAVTHVAPGDHVRLLYRPRVPLVPATAAPAGHLCLPAGRTATVRGTLIDGTSRLSLPDGTPLQHALRRRASPTASSSPPRARSRCRASFLSGRRRSSVAAS